MYPTKEDTIQHSNGSVVPPTKLEEGGNFAGKKVWRGERDGCGMCCGSVEERARKEEVQNVWTKGRQVPNLNQEGGGECD